VSPSRSPVRALASPQRRGSHREKLEALLVVDMQRDFLPGGSLAIDGADRLIPVINSLHDLPRWAMVVFVQDWHPADHCSFASNQNGVPFTDVDLVVDGKTIRQTLWPDHCVQNTPGAELHPDLVVARHDRHLRKGTNRNYDSYSGFKDNCGNEPTGLEALLKDHNITDVFVVGVATEFCVAFTALHALEAGFATTVIVDACQAIEQDVADKLLQRYRRRGGKVAYAQDVQGEPPGLHI
jgi:nicotinamidase/pyrazinamidase